MIIRTRATPFAILVILFAVALAPVEELQTYAMASASQDQKQQTADTQSRERPQADAPQDEEETESEELSPASVQLDTSSFPPLILALYQATRETKEKPAVAKLAEVRELIEKGSDVTTTDSSGRTALHWAGMGSSHSTKESLLTAYTEVADKLITRGVPVNHEDVYNNTVLDYLLYSPNIEMQTLLLENSATSGSFVGLAHHIKEGRGQAAKGATPVQTGGMQEVNLTPGLMIPIRLNTSVWSDKSRIGDPVEAVVTSPVVKGSQVLLPPGTKLDGTVLFAQKAPNQYSRPRLVLDLSNVIHRDGSRSALYARVLAVDNARELVENNEIRGIIQPHASKTLSIAMTAVGIADPAVGYAVRGMRTAYGASLRREIAFPAGTDLTIQVVLPSVLKKSGPWQAWPVLAVEEQLRRLVQDAPLRTEATNRIPSDLTNVFFIGKREELEAAFQAAGWKNADHLGLKSAMEELQAAARKSGYDQAPVSLLTLNGAQPDVVFQKALNTISKRHHVRLWKQTGVLYEGREIWVAAATHDIGVAASGKGTKWFHRIDPRVDREREWIKNELLFAGAASGYALVERPAAPTRTRNATGDEVITDGKMLVLALGRSKASP
jgi:hypothetical protein